MDLEKLKEELRHRAFSLHPRPQIEHHKPDLSLAYSTLAPKVSEAWAFLRCGAIEEAKEVMESAQAVIDSATMSAVTIEVPAEGLSK